MNNIYNIKSSGNNAIIQDLDTKKGIVTGYFSSFDSIDADGDIIRKGAYTKTIAENFSRIKHLYNHNTTQPLGVLKTLVEDSKGLYYESKIGTHSLGVDFIKMVESGLITEHSVGFQTVKRQKQKDYTEIKEVKLYEGSSLSFLGANGNTPILGVKSFNNVSEIETIIERSKAVEKFCRNSDASDETIQLLLLEHKQLTQTIADLYTKINTKPSAETLPFDSVKAAETINNFINKLNS